jgi:probable rRNA maturation factor
VSDAVDGLQFIRIAVYNRQRSLSIDLPFLRQFACIALGECLAIDPPCKSLLHHLPEIEITIVSDQAIARLHQQFMGIAGPTDVLTFEHGEIVISAQTAAENALRFRKTPDEEIALYIAHGLLHLHGFDDLSENDSALMKKTQKCVMNASLRLFSPSVSP